MYVLEIPLMILYIRDIFSTTAPILSKGFSLNFNNMFKATFNLKPQFFSSMGGLYMLWGRLCMTGHWLTYLTTVRNLNFKATFNVKPQFLSSMGVL